MEILSKLGVDVKILLAQIVNFLILLWVLKRFAYRPMLEFLEKRAEKIEQGLKDATAAKKQLAAVAQEEKEILARAKMEAKSLLEQAESMAKKNEMRLIEEARAEAGRLIALTEEKLAVEKTKLLTEARAELSIVVVAAVEKVLAEKLDAEKDGELIKRSLRILEK